jgi:UDP-glucuronate 4-epimerase
VDHPTSLYAASKKSNELMAHTYSHLFELPCTGLRFFTVYGPWGRPDMALSLFTRDILAGRPIQIFNNGNMQRDFTYIDDIVEAMIRLLPMPPTPDADWNGDNPNPSSSCAPWHIYNIGNNRPVNLMDFVETLEEALGKKAIKQYLPMQKGDVEATWADVDDLYRKINMRPDTPLKVGVNRFISWYMDYYQSDG